MAENVSLEVLAERIAGLNELVDRRFIEADRAVTAALAAAEKATEKAFTASAEAVAKAEQAQLRVNETQNEFRGTLKDQANDLMPRVETELMFREMTNKLDDLRTSRDATAGRSAGVSLSAVVAGFMVTTGVSITGFVVYVLTH